MSVHGQYCLTLFCDGGDSCPRGRVSALFTADTRAAARQNARDSGWMLTRAKTTFCKDCTPAYLERPHRWKHRALDGNLMPLKRQDETTS
jgi:hypothetical protein